MKTSKVLIVTLFISLLFSCTVDKRVYNKGFFVNKTTNIKNKTNRNINASEQVAKVNIDQSFATSKNTPKQEEKQLLTAQNNAMVVTNKSKVPQFVLENCDSLIMKDGSLKLVKIISINDSTMHVSNCQDASVSEIIGLGDVMQVSGNKGDRFKFIPHELKNSNTTYYETKTIYHPKEKKLRAMSFASFGMSIGAIIIAAFMFFALAAWPVLIVLGAIGIVALILGVYSYIKMKNLPNLRSQKIYAILGIAFGSFLIALVAVILLAIGLGWLK